MGADALTLQPQRIGTDRTGGSVGGAGVAQWGGGVPMLRRGRTNANGASREPSHKDLRGLWATVPVAQEVEDDLG